MHYLHFSADINPATVQSLIATLLQVAATPDHDVYVLMNSNGGNVMAGIHAHAMMMAMPLNITVHNVGNVDSIANVIFLAGNDRRCSPPGTFMFHSVGYDQNTPIRLEEGNLTQLLDSVAADNKRMAGIISGRTNLTVGRTRTLFRTQSTRDAQWAHKHGFVHQIAFPQIPAGTSLVQVVV